eukprot:TRINITY_DN11773_c0_g1_i1.p1 TRINITY_DN11773_c0_g1~~TRINITY_DN11773_c0_g1_i1.p1  ORF type:complete len:246 (-),score=80.66 TRINITY_DN11773_c0_g1_i1:405-1142(-)
MATADENAMWEGLDTKFVWYDTAQAKKRFFLGTDDLLELHAAKGRGGFGCRPRTYYRENDLKAAAILKHTEEGYKKKKAAREKREAKKRAREEEAEEASKRLKVSDDGATNAAEENVAPVDPAVLKACVANRKLLLRQARKTIGSLKFVGHCKKWRIEVPNYTPELFAAMVLRPSDPELKTIVKRGAFHSIDVPAAEFFGLSSGQEINGTGGRYGSGSQVRMDDVVTARFKPSDGSLSVGGEAFC